MEEIEKLKVVALDKYLADDQFTQIEDLLATCSVKMSSSLTGILENIYEVRGTGKKPDLDSIAGDIRNIVQHIAVMAHCFELYVPELEEMEEFIDEEFDDDSRMDATMCVLSIQHIYSNMVLDHFAGAFELDDADMVDMELMQVGIIDMCASALTICNKYKLDFTQTVVYG